jgi:hypothetical protein
VTKPGENARTLVVCVVTAKRHPTFISKLSLLADQTRTNGSPFVRHLDGSSSNAIYKQLVLSGSSIEDAERQILWVPQPCSGTQHSSHGLCSFPEQNLRQQQASACNPGFWTGCCTSRRGERGQIWAASPAWTPCSPAICSRLQQHFDAPVAWHRLHA